MNSCALNLIKEMPRKRKTANDWAAEFSDLEAKEKRPKNDTEDRITHVGLVCRYCSIEFDIDPKKKPWDRVQEHLASRRHKKLKENHEKCVESSKQLRQKSAKDKRRKRLLVQFMISCEHYHIQLLALTKQMDL